MRLDKINFSDLESEDPLDPEVDYQKARCYLYGVGGVSRDREKGAKLMVHAANMGCYGAIQFLKMYEEEVTKDNLPQWCVWAENGDAEAMVKVASYFQFNAIPGTIKDVYRYLTSAAAQGYEDALYLLADELDDLYLNELADEFAQGYKEWDKEEEKERNPLGFNRSVMVKLANEYVKNKEWRSLPKAFYWREMTYDAGGNKTDLDDEVAELENHWPGLE